eukprot:gene23149-24513_t
MRHRLSLLLAVSVPLAGCTVGPDYHPATPATLGVPAHYSVPADGRPAADLSAWWTRFNDPLLAQIVERARTGNLDIAQAVARLRQARESLIQSRAQLLPTLSGSAGYTRSENIRGGTTTALANGTVISTGGGSDTLSLGLDVSYQVGLFGELRRTLEASRASYVASGYNYATVLLSTQAETARNYMLARLYQAQLANARVQLSRYNTLLGQDSIARQDVDTQAATAKQLQGTIAIDRGAVQQAQINLGYTRIISPVSGRVGLKVVDVGNYIGAGDTNGIAVVTTLQPIDVEFAVPQDQAPVIAKRINQGAQIPAIALDRTRTQTLDQGRFSTLDNQVDTTTGTIKGKARFANAANQLYPSQFVNVRLTVDTAANAITIPPAAVRSGQDSAFVWLLKGDRTVTQRKVTTGVTSADKVQILTGLKLGDTVVTDG